MDTNSVGISLRSNRRMAWKNAFFFSLLLGWVAIPLIVLRGSELLQTNWFMPLFTLVCVFLVWIWFRFSVVGEPGAKTWQSPTSDLWIALSAIALVTLVAFYLPQRKNFWGGFDDFSAFDPSFLHLWGKSFDLQSGRPFLGWSYFFGRAVGSGRIEGFIAFAGLLCFANATILFVYIRSLLPNAKALALASAFLLIVNRSDPLKFFPLWAASPYGLAVTLLLLAMWSFHVSWRSQHRGLLLLSCASLGATLLMYEVGYLLSFIPILLLYLYRKQNRFFFFWVYSWFATLCLFAIRVVIYQLTNKSSYQLQQARESQLSLEVISRNALAHLKPIETYWKISEFTWTYIAVATFIFVIVAVSIYWVGRYDLSSSLKVSVLVPLLATLGILLAIAPYSHIAYVARTQFFASPFQAVLLVFLIALVGRNLPKRIAIVGLGLVIGIVAANATAESYHLQDRKFHVSFDKTVHVCQQILACSSTLTDDELVVLLHKEPSPLGVSYSIFAGGPHWTGVRIASIGDAPNPQIQVEFQEDYATVKFFGDVFRRYSYSHLLVFRLDEDGTLFFETTWPKDSRIPVTASGYDPIQLLRTSRIALRSDFNFPAWSGPPDDVVRQRDGILLGRGWSSMQFENGWLYRNVKQGAQLIVNSQGQSQVEFDLDIGPRDPTSTSNVLEILNADDVVVMKVELDMRRVVPIKLPCSPAHLEVFRIRSYPDSLPTASGRDVFKIYSKHGPISENPLPTVAKDIASGGIVLDEGWYPREIFEGKVFRWLNTDGKFLTGFCKPNESPGILLQIEPGPGMEGKPCSIELWNEHKMLASRSISSKEEWTIKLPVDYPQDSQLILRVLGGGKQVPPDDRILNLMVTKCEWQPKVILPPDILKGNIDLGAGWYPYELFGGDNFRWLNTNAELILESKEPSLRSCLILDVSPGPGMNGMPGVIEVLDSQGKVLASSKFDQPTKLTLQLNDLPSGSNTVRLQVLGGGNAIPNDPRILNVQVFQCEWRIDTTKE